VMNDQNYELIVSRLGKLVRTEIMPTKAPRQLKEIAIIDRALAEKSFMLVKTPWPSQMA